jgi:membrane-bound metal-dependent hydrolase YbcI (DUF457 family)
MPSYKGHLFGGSVTFLALYGFASKMVPYISDTVEGTVFSLVFCLAGALFPDIDTPSLARMVLFSLLPLLMLNLFLTQQWTIFATLVVVCLVPLCACHRGVTHTVWFISLIPLPIYLSIVKQLPQSIGSFKSAYIYFVAGGISHLAMDFVNLKTIRRFFFRFRIK